MEWYIRPGGHIQLEYPTCLLTKSKRTAGMSFGCCTAAQAYSMLLVYRCMSSDKRDRLQNAKGHLAKRMRIEAKIEDATPETLPPAASAPAQLAVASASQVAGPCAQPASQVIAGAGLLAAKRRPSAPALVAVRLAPSHRKRFPQAVQASTFATAKWKVVGSGHARTFAGWASTA